MSANKAISWDGISDKWLRSTTNYALLQDLWRPEVLDLFQNLGYARLIPLNKDYPDIPKQDRFRPIVVLSSLFKFIMLRFIG